MKKKTTKKVSKKTASKKSKKKMRVSPRGVLKAAKNLRKTTKKMVDDVFLKFVGMRVLERAQAMSASLKEEKARAEVSQQASSKKTSKKRSAKVKKG